LYNHVFGDVTFKGVVFGGVTFEGVVFGGVIFEAVVFGGDSFKNNISVTQSVAQLIVQSVA
jgi:uncharacterized protein YjbI with pentapeptide repeats